MRRFVALVPILAFAFGCSSVPPNDDLLDDDPASVPTASYDVGAIPVSIPEGAAIFRGDVGVMVPAAGVTAGVVLESVDGTSTSLAITRMPDGSIGVGEGTGPLVVESGTNECKDGAYSLEGFRWAKSYAWSFRSSTTPAANGVASVEDALKRAATNITGMHNKCSIADAVSATHAYQGRTTKATNIASTTTTVSCGKPDGTNVVAFGVLPIKYLGITCYWYDGNKHAVEADVKLSTRHAWFATAQVPAGCNNRFGVEATMTHEFGHAFGLGHVSETTHGELTMSTAMPPCTLSPTSLGLGDVKGLKSLY